MIYTDMTKRAMRIAFDVHKDQVDKTGLPYIFHPFHIAEQMTDEISICIALLHDVVEDSPLTFDDLRKQGISLAVTETLKLLTHENSVPYMDYIKRIKESGNQWAVNVKLADLRHNSDISRLDCVDEKAISRIRKYQEAINLLEHQWCYESNENIYIEKEHGTGWIFYVLRVNGTAFCSSKNIAPMPRSFTDPIQTDDLINKKTLTTYKNPDYEHITIAPGLKLEYPVFSDNGQNQVAKMQRTYNGGIFTCHDHYYILDEKNANPRVDIDTDAPGDLTFLEHLPHNDVTVCIYPDKSFVYDPHSLVEERYVVSIGKQHLQWLPHVFHAYFLRRNI
jgi:hypothetical protein